MPVDPAFKSFHPVISRWFQDALGVPTPIQKVAWPKIAEGKHVLVTAPTGTGKTFTAFLWAINQLVSGVWDIGQTSVLYVSPLKALNNDIQRNLIVPLEQLRRQFDKSNIAFPEIRVQTRSGDTPSSERRKMLRRPPEIFITTPESLNILLSTQSGQNIFSNLRTVVLDEIHAVVGSKRGTHLITAVDRLVPFSGEFQRIALSATVRPLKIVSEFVGGYRLSADPKHPQYDPRSVSVIEVPGEKPYMMRVFFPEPQPYPTEDPWLSLIKDLKTIIANNRSTLIFVNNRRLCERITLKINAGEDQPVAYAHHGSLSKPIREHVEYKLKNGELKAIVATNSLELGIDIGALDEVVLIQCPPKISSGIQRIGRSGHRVGEISRGTLFPTYPHDILESAVLTSEVLAGRIEDVHPIDCPLDVLAQIIVSMAATQVWDIDDLFTQIRSSYAFHGLSRSQFDLVLQMLNGRY